MEIKYQSYESYIVNNWGTDWPAEIDITNSLLHEKNSELTMADLRWLSGKMMGVTAGKHDAKVLEFHQANQKRE